MCTRGECVRYMGQWVHFSTPWGYHRGIVMDVNDRAVLVRTPRRYAPVGLVSDVQSVDANHAERLDVTLSQWYPGWGYARWGYPGWGGWRAGWYWWWLAFAWIFALAALWW
jgi:hypothetical protein